MIQKQSISFNSCVNNSAKNLMYCNHMQYQQKLRTLAVKASISWPLQPQSVIDQVRNFLTLFLGQTANSVQLANLLHRINILSSFVNLESGKGLFRIIKYHRYFALDQTLFYDEDV